MLIARRVLVVDVDRRLLRFSVAASRTVDLDFARGAFRFQLFHVDVKQAGIKISAENFDVVGKDEAALELPRGDSAVQVDALRIILLPAADRQLVLFDFDIEIVHGETGDGQRDAQSLFIHLFDIVGG